MLAQQVNLSQTRCDPLSWEDRQIIADICTWDMCRFVSPEEIETIRIEADMVMIYLTGGRCNPISVSQFKQIRKEQQKQRQYRHQQRQPQVVVSSVRTRFGLIHQVFVDGSFVGCYEYVPRINTYFALKPQQSLKPDFSFPSRQQAISFLINK